MATVRRDMLARPGRSDHRTDVPDVVTLEHGVTATARLAEAFGVDAELLESISNVVPGRDPFVQPLGPTPECLSIEAISEHARLLRQITRLEPSLSMDLTAMSVWKQHLTSCTTCIENVASYIRISEATEDHRDEELDHLCFGLLTWPELHISDQEASFIEVRLLQLGGTENATIEPESLLMRHPINARACTVTLAAALPRPQYGSVYSAIFPVSDKRFQRLSASAICDRITLQGTLTDGEHFAIDSTTCIEVKKR